MSQFQDNIGQYAIVDGLILESASIKETEPDQEATLVYEVIRLIDGVPLFFEEHYARMQASVQAVLDSTYGSDSQSPGMIEESALLDQIQSLAKANGLTHCNVKFIDEIVHGRQSITGYISKSYYPSMEEVGKGVPTGLLYLERENPNLKILVQAYKDKVNHLKAEQGYYEVLLVDRQDYLTEGSASNLFFVIDQKIWTAPGHTVLKGITRSHVIEACQNAGFEVVEELVSVKDLDQIQGLFLSGTSPKVLPISSIDGKAYPSAQLPAIQAIREEYDRILAHYIQSH